MIRKLEEKDLPYMQEWMQDKVVTANLKADFASMTQEKIGDFISKASKQNIDDNNVHFAIVDDKDEYMGTISLKNINYDDKNAEYAIVTRAIAHGKGYANRATNEILKYGFEKLGLEKIYLYVSIDNLAANKFYLKCGFKEEGVFRKHISINGILTDIRWYSMLREEHRHKEQ